MEKGNVKLSSFCDFTKATETDVNKKFTVYIYNLYKFFHPYKCKFSHAPNKFIFTLLC